MLNEFGHVLDEQGAEFTGISVSSSGFTLQLRVPRGCVLDLVAWRIPASAKAIREQLGRLTSFETQSRFLWGSHTAYQRPADVYSHLICGEVYENRRSWPKYRKIFSENDAHALYVILSGLEKATDKKMYGLFKAQLLLSVIARQGEDGGWRHGEWTDRMESHYRLHCSAMHMLMDALDEQEDSNVRMALNRAAAYLSRQTDTLDVGVWFLHDGLEHSVETMQEGPFRWLRSRALGKSEANMLVLNSHLDATIALDRYGQVTGDGRYERLVAQANAATRIVLALQPAQWLYASMFWAIRLTFLPSARAAQLPLLLRGLKRLSRKYLIPLLSHLKARYPRIVMPGGYIERELSLQIFAHEYLPINLMDLLRFRRRFPNESVDAVIDAALRLVYEYRMFERWLEIKGKEYAVGFWAEALYHTCMLRPQAHYRAWLAQAVVILEARGLGLPPSLLGANSEAVALEDQVPTPTLDDARIRVVNLSRRDHIEVLLINCSEEMARPTFLQNPPQGILWTAGANEGASENVPPEMPGGGWLWGRRQPATGHTD
jgi:hypothetical protein